MAQIAPFQINNETPVSFLTVGQLRQIILDTMKGDIPTPNDSGKDDPEYISEAKARCVLSGTEKPLSKDLFYRLRRKGHFEAYRIGESRRVLYKRSELIATMQPKNAA